ncbi:MAG: thymidylate kinase [Acidobacteriota bacterium]|nr:thymidylate kinase [Blastocatellia bacterium]MDW8238805.1 thymidylate kinase [Acidobacteriota bacterium]
MTPKRFYGTGIPGVNVEQLKGTLIVIEGADGSGRSTQIALLRDWLERLGYATSEVGLKRSRLVEAELEEAMQGNILSPLTLCLFYATDFADQLEHTIIPALRSGFVVLADRYIYTLMARAIVRGAHPEWIRDVYSIALVPDAVFYLEVSPKILAERNFRKNATLDYWESGMDIRRSGDMYECFIRYQRQIQRELRAMRTIYHFDTINGNRSIRAVANELQAKIEIMLNPHLVEASQGAGS